MKVVPLKWKAAVLLVTLGTLTVALCMPSAASSCGESFVVRDYLEQVKRAAPIKEVPKLEDPRSSHLPFAPTGLRLRVVGVDLMTKSSKIGFRLDNPFFGALRHLDWIVESELVKVNARGKPIQSLGIKRRGIGTFKGGMVVNLSHRVSGTPAYYRFDIRFVRKGTDRVLGKYSSYARVMKPRVDLRLRRIDKYTVAPGEYAKANLLNLGTLPLITSSYDFGFDVEVFTGERWILQPHNPRRRVPKVLRQWALGPGLENRDCLRYLVPSDQAPGALFRFVISDLVTKTETLTAEFQVASSP